MIPSFVYHGREGRFWVDSGSSNGHGGRLAIFFQSECNIPEAVDTSVLPDGADDVRPQVAHQSASACWEGDGEGGHCGVSTVDFDVDRKSDVARVSASNNGVRFRVVEERILTIDV